MILACAAIDIAAACFAILCVIGLLSWRWNGRYSSEDPICTCRDRGIDNLTFPGPRRNRK